MKSTMIAIFFFILMIACVLFLPQFLYRRGAKQVISIFRYHGALSADTAKTSGELGLVEKSYAQRMVSLRDYKPAALNVLLQEGIVVSTEDGKLYLAEGKLSAIFDRKS